MPDILYRRWCKCCAGASQTVFLASIASAATSASLSGNMWRMNNKDGRWWVAFGDVR